MPVRIAFLGALLLAACGPYDPSNDPTVPGDPLGTYQVRGELSEDDCGADLLGAPDPWLFQIRLSRFQDDLYWLNGREAIIGEVDPKTDAFELKTRVDVPIGEAERGAPLCILSRYDRAEGVFSTEGEVVTGFVGNLSFSYEAKDGSECYEILNVPGGVQELPCSLAYTLTAELSGDPGS